MVLQSTNCAKQHFVLVHLHSLKHLLDNYTYYFEVLVCQELGRNLSAAKRCKFVLYQIKISLKYCQARSVKCNPNF